MTETFFKKGARIKKEVRVALIEAAKPAPVNDKSEAYAVAKSNLQKPWARRWMRVNGFTAYL